MTYDKQAGQELDETRRRTQRDPRYRLKAGQIPCWQCGKALEKHPKTQQLIFVRVELAKDSFVRVHRICAANAKRALSI